MPVSCPCCLVKRLLVCLAVALCSSGTLGHHSAGVYFDVDAVIELSGEITEVVWRNPHVYFIVRATDGETWNVESNSVSILRRMGLTEDLVNAGDRVQIAGWPGRQRENRVFALNMLLPDGVELILWPGMAARWSDDPLGAAGAMAADGESTPSSLGIGNDIFRVWSSNMANPASFPLFPDVAGAAPEYPLTEAAIAARATWDPAADNPYLTCEPVGMPRIMGQPYPMEFIDEGERIVLRIELYDVVRTVHMAGGASGEESGAADGVGSEVSGEATDAVSGEATDAVSGAVSGEATGAVSGAVSGEATGAVSGAVSGQLSGGEASGAVAPAPAPQGYSRGTWEGGTLVVRTNRLGWPYFDQSGIPQSPRAELLERFTPSADGTRLDYVLTVTDPATFTEPVTLQKYWTWRPDAQVRPFECNAEYRP